MTLFAVIGGAGRTGRRVADRLLERGHEVRIVSRHAPPQNRTGIYSANADLATMPLDDPALADAAGIVVSVEPPCDAAGADAVVHRGVTTVAEAAARRDVLVVLVSQIYITRPGAYPAMAEVTRARGRGEQALRGTGAPYVIVRPGWLHDGPPTGVRLEQGDTGDGPVSRDSIADACVHALLTPSARALTFEVFDDAARPAAPTEWPRLLAELSPDGSPPVTAGPRRSLYPE
jgi:uncharacterized protein YbjT (DUF2867 family)